MKLINYKNNVYSQNGEDGIIHAIFASLKEKVSDNKWCVEFGAWDGKYLSNTFNLVEQGWNAVYIEGDAEKYKDLLITVEAYPKIIPLLGMVDFDKESQNSLDNLLARTILPSDYELLSIDIDSFDLAVWAAYCGTPKVVVIEINSTVKPGILHWHDGEKYQGNSFSSTLTVAEAKGYALVAHTGNLIFVRKDLVNMLDIDDLDLTYPERLFSPERLPDPQPSSLSLFIARKLLSNRFKRFLKRY